MTAYNFDLDVETSSSILEQLRDVERIVRNDLRLKDAYKNWIGAALRMSDTHIGESGASLDEDDVLWSQFRAHALNDALLTINGVLKGALSLAEENHHRYDENYLRDLAISKLVPVQKAIEIAIRKLEA